MKTPELFDDTESNKKRPTPVLKKSQPLRCLCCAFAMDTPTPYPQLCKRCRVDMHASLVIIATDCEELEAKWRTALRASSDEYQERFVAFLEAAGSAYGPASYPSRQKAIAEFNRRADATVAKGGDFARLVTAWRAWHTRCADRDIMQIMMVFRAEAVE
jgi:hypothetical protein